MKYAVSADEMKRYDRNTSEEFGISSEVLMERAALCCARHIVEWCDDRKLSKPRVLILAGCGNNGGDGIAIGRLLKQKGFIVTESVIGDYTKCTDALLHQLKIAEKYGILQVPFSQIKNPEYPRDYDVIVDALFGIGCNRPLAASYAEAVDYVAKQKTAKGDELLVLSVDMPSGINADDGSICQKAVKADITVTFNFTKAGHILFPGADYAGKVCVEDVGITEDSFMGKKPRAFFYDEDISMLLPKRNHAGNKGSFGKILVIAGNPQVSGACLLASEAAFRTGAGMVRVFTAAENRALIASKLPEALIDTYEQIETDNIELIRNRLHKAFEWATAVVLGPGIGLDEFALQLVKIVLEDCDKKLIIDADALTLIAGNDVLKRLVINYGDNSKWIIMTPHLGEFARLYGKSIKECKADLLNAPKKVADMYKCTVLCKDARSIVASSDEKQIYINVSGNDGMATAGSGDVLSGIVGALSAGEGSAFETAAIASYLHGLAGDFAKNERGCYSMIAGDLIPSLEKILKG